MHRTHEFRGQVGRDRLCVALYTGDIAKSLQSTGITGSGGEKRDLFAVIVCEIVVCALLLAASQKYHGIPNVN